MIFKLHKLYVAKVDKLLDHIKSMILPSVLEVQEADTFENNIKSLDPNCFVNFNNSSNSLSTVLCDEVRLHSYCTKLRDITTTIKSNKNVYNLLYTSPIESIRTSSFFLSDTSSYTDEYLLVMNFKEKALQYILTYNLLKESNDSLDQINHLRLTIFTNNLNETVCSLLKLQIDSV